MLCADPVAFVEDVREPPLASNFMDYVASGKVIRLRPNDMLVLSYMNSCRSERIVGGTVAVGLEQSEVQGGKVTRTKVPCDAAQFDVNSKQSIQSAGTVFRGASEVPSLTLYGLSPVVEAAGGTALLIVRLDRTNEYHVATLPKKKGNPRTVLDLAVVNRVLTPAARIGRASDHARLSSRSRQTRNPPHVRDRSPAPVPARKLTASREPHPPARRAHGYSDRTRDGLHSCVPGAGIATRPLDRCADRAALAGLRHTRMIPPRRPPWSSPSTRRPIRTPPFEGTPNVTWTREIGRVLTAIVDGGAKRGRLRHRLSGLDRAVGDAVRRRDAGRAGARLRPRLSCARWRSAPRARARWCWARSSIPAHPIQPSPGQRIAVGQQRNIRALNAYSDADDVIRRMPLSFAVDGVRTPSMALELAARARDRRNGATPAS